MHSQQLSVVDFGKKRGATVHGRSPLWFLRCIVLCLPVAGLLFFSGCGGNDTALQTVPSAAQTSAEPVQGPADYEAITAMLNPADLVMNPANFVSPGIQASLARKNIPITDSSSKGVINSAKAVGGVIWLFAKGGKSTIGPLFDLFKLFMPEAETIDQNAIAIAEIRVQLKDIQTQIDQQTSYFDSFVEKTDQNLSCNVVYHRLEDLAGVIDLRIFGTSYRHPFGWKCNPITFYQNQSNKYGSFMSLAGLNCGDGSKCFSMNDIKTSALDKEKMQNLKNFAAIQNTIDTTNQISALASRLSGSLYIKTNSDDPHLDVTSLPLVAGCAGSTIINYYACQLEYLRDNLIPKIGERSPYDVVKVLDAYNENISNTYFQNSLALQMLYTIEATSNYMNYLNYIDACIEKRTKLTQIQGWETEDTINVIVFNESNCSKNSVDAGNDLARIQQNLTHLYAARFNILFKHTMSYIISDPLMPNQSYVPPPKNDNMDITGTQAVPFLPQRDLYTTMRTDTLSPIGLNLPPSVNGRLIPSREIIDNGGAFYQYPGIKQFYSCQHPSNDASQCVSAFPRFNGQTPYYDGLRIRALTPDITRYNGSRETSTLELADDCGVDTIGKGSSAAERQKLAGPVYWQSGNTIVCKSWSGNRYTSPVYSKKNLLESSLGKIIPPFDNVPYMLYYPELTARAGVAFTIDVRNSDFSEFDLLASSQDSKGTSAWHIRYDGYGKPYLWNGGLDSSSSGHHTALLQYHLRGMYNFPFYLEGKMLGELFSLRYWIVGGPICPNAVGASPSGLVSCKQMEHGRIDFATTDGGVYSLTIKDAQGAVKALNWPLACESGSLYDGISKSCYKLDVLKDLPGGQYTQYCENISKDGNNLYATCDLSTNMKNPNKQPLRLNYEACSFNNPVFFNPMNKRLECSGSTRTPSGSYLDSCSLAGFENGVLKALCPLSPPWSVATLNYANECIVDSKVSFSIFKKLVCDSPRVTTPTGSYLSFCQDIKFDGQTLTASCLGKSASLDYKTCAATGSTVSYNLQDGSLRCDKY